jgi:hypothetical protein
MPRAYRAPRTENWELWVEPENRPRMLMSIFPNNEEEARATADRLNMMCGNTTYRVHLGAGTAAE